jgi:serine/threonine-protein kinase
MPSRLGRYEIIRELGKGAMGIVYEGRDPNIGRRVAIKTARKDVVAASGMAAEMMERFLREARAAGALTHPNIITIYDADEEDGITYIAMEFIQGGNLADVIRNRSRLGFDEIVDYGATIALALAAAHDAGIIHRDIKPANILTPTGGPIKLADFGIAHVSDSNLTQDGAMIGTPHYMSPEQFMGQKVDGRSDLFSVGVLLYELVTGEKPFSGEGLSAVMHNVTRVQPVPPKDLNFAVPDALNDVILKVLSKRPADRYADGRAFAAALRESVKDQPNLAALQLDPALSEETVNLTPVPGDTVMTPTGALDANDTTLQRTAAMTTPLTKIGGPPPGVNTPPPVAPDPSVSITTNLPKRSPVPILVSAAGFVVLLGVIGYMSLGGDPASAPAGAPVENATAGAAPVADQPFYTGVSIDLYRALDEEAYAACGGLEPDQQKFDEFIDRLKEVTLASVQVFDGKPAGELLVENPEFAGGKLSWEGNPAILRYHITLPDGTDTEITDIKRATEPGQTAPPKIIVMAPAAP